MIYNFDPLYSAYPQHRNQTLKFLPADDEERYENNIQKRLSELKTYGWYNKEIDYTFNSYGFRSDEFEEASVPSILFLGCSYTVGVGIRIEDSFTSIISKELGFRNYNLGLGGGGPDTAFRIGHHWIPQLKPKYVVWMDIFKERYEEIVKIGDGTKEKVLPMIQIIDKNRNHTYLSANHWYINSLKNYIGVKHTCDRFKIKLIHSRIFKRLDYARDLAHPGKMSNEQVAEEILTQIQNRGE